MNEAHRKVRLHPSIVFRNDTLAYRLRDGLSYCRVDNYLIFLDLQHDRYFRLPGKMERTFLAYTRRWEDSHLDLSNLIEREILVDEKNLAQDHTLSHVIEAPYRSAMEQSESMGTFRAATLLDVVAIVLSTQLRLKTRGLKDSLDRLVAYRHERAAETRSTPVDHSELRLLGASATFRHMRLFVPVDTCCLLDSLSMVIFLAKRGLHANIVFGVSGNPFAAHCWVQAKDIVLNDSVGNANAHSAIRVV